jgi:hypothetical protein
VKSTNRRHGMLAVVVTAVLCTFLIGVGLSTGTHRAEPRTSAGRSSHTPDNAALKQLRPLCSVLRRHCAPGSTVLDARTWCARCRGARR